MATKKLLQAMTMAGESVKLEAALNALGRCLSGEQDPHSMVRFALDVEMQSKDAVQLLLDCQERGILWSVVEIHASQMRRKLSSSSSGALPNKVQGGAAAKKGGGEDGQSGRGRGQEQATVSGSGGVNSASTRSRKIERVQNPKKTKEGGGGGETGRGRRQEECLAKKTGQQRREGRARDGVGRVGDARRLHRHEEQAPACVQDPVEAGARGRRDRAAAKLQEAEARVGAEPRRRQQREGGGVQSVRSQTPARETGCGAKEARCPGYLRGTQSKQSRDALCHTQARRKEEARRVDAAGLARRNVCKPDPAQATVRGAKKREGAGTRARRTDHLFGFGEDFVPRTTAATRYADLDFGCGVDGSKLEADRTITKENEGEGDGVVKAQASVTQGTQAPEEGNIARDLAAAAAIRYGTSRLADADVTRGMFSVSWHLQAADDEDVAGGAPPPTTTQSQLPAAVEAQENVRGSTRSVNCGSGGGFRRSATSGGGLKGDEDDDLFTEINLSDSGDVRGEVQATSGNVDACSGAGAGGLSTKVYSSCDGGGHQAELSSDVPLEGDWEPGCGVFAKYQAELGSDVPLEGDWELGEPGCGVFAKYQADLGCDVPLEGDWELGDPGYGFFADYQAEFGSDVPSVPPYDLTLDLPALPCIRTRCSRSSCGSGSGNVAPAGGSMGAELGGDASRFHEAELLSGGGSGCDFPLVMHGEGSGSSTRDSLPPLLYTPMTPPLWPVPVCKSLSPRPGEWGWFGASRENDPLIQLACACACKLEDSPPFSEPATAAPSSPSSTASAMSCLHSRMDKGGGAAAKSKHLDAVEESVAIASKVAAPAAAAGKAAAGPRARSKTPPANNAKRAPWRG